MSSPAASTDLNALEHDGSHQRGFLLSEAWAARPDVKQLRMCESGDRLHAVSPTGKYHGLYQTTARWGRGDRRTQNAGAYRLWLKHGCAPWPYCGRYLR